MQRALDHLEANFDGHLEDLKRLVRIPSVSFAGFPADEVVRSAETVAELLRVRGFQNVEILRLPGAHPYVYGEHVSDRAKPTLLLYAHHDVQPPGRAEVWKTSPFEPVLKAGPGGERLYGRGCADDKAGIIVHTAAISAFLEGAGELPVNLKIVVEGEEESGSEHLYEFLRKYRSRLSADVLVLTDTTNFDVGVPGLTVSLRGMIAMQVEVQALSKTVHSGMWGGPVPDPAMALAKILGSLADDAGQIAVPAVRKMAPKISAKDSAVYKKLPFAEKRFREQCGMAPGTKLLRVGPSPWAQIWRMPSVTVNALQASSRAQAGNIINDKAWGRFSVRLAPGMDPKKVSTALKAHLKKATPWGLKLTVTEESQAGPWQTRAWEDKGVGAVAFAAAESALKRGYGRAVVKMGCGGTIPFVEPFAKALGGAPALLIGVEDPFTDAHGENESLHIGDFKKACISQVLLFQELADRMRK